MKITEIVKETHDTKRFIFSYQNDERIDFKAGQFVMVHGIEVEKDGETKKYNRAYSLACPPGKDHIELIIKKEEPGITSPKWVNEVQVGEEYEVKGPFGKFFYEESLQGDVVLLAAGSGIAPMRGIAQYILEKELPVQIHLVFCNKTEEDIICREEFDKMASDHDNFHVHHTLTREEDGSAWDGHRGRTDKDFIAQSVGDVNNKLYYICGPLAFGKSMEEALKELAVPSDVVRKEIFG